MPDAIPLSLYVHLPWCIKKCPYCDFNSHALRDDSQESAYTNALLEDLQEEAQRAGNRPVSSIFFGGGTPSLFSPQAIGKILEKAAAQLNLTDDCEITLEANPGASDEARFAGYRAAGVNRLSIGVQSFDDKALQRLGRIHDRNAAIHAVHAARQAGFENLNLDLMFALPDQDVSQALADVRQALALAPTHLSHYQLTIEPNTLFWHQPPQLPADELAWDIQNACHAEIDAAGFEQYEISAWSQPGKACRHNVNYWQFGDYLAIGAGAHGKLTNGDQITRRSKLRHPQAYLDAKDSRTDQKTMVDEKDRPFEFMLNALRLRKGFDEADYLTRTGLSLESLQPTLNEMITDGLLQQTETRITTTDHGWQFVNDVQERFLPQDKSAT